MKIVGDVAFIENGKLIEVLRKNTVESFRIDQEFCLVVSNSRYIGIPADHVEDFLHWIGYLEEKSPDVQS
jgi:hypothetical protein